MVEPHTVVPSFRPVKSNVVPEGTATADSTMVEQAVLDLLADEAPLDPEKVQLVALSANCGAAVTWALAGSGSACTAAAPKSPKMQNLVLATMMNRKALSENSVKETIVRQIEFPRNRQPLLYPYFSRMHLASSREISQPFSSCGKYCSVQCMFKADRYVR
jgi:hypothetical protein